MYAQQKVTPIDKSFGTFTLRHIKMFTHFHLLFCVFFVCNFRFFAYYSFPCTVTIKTFPPATDLNFPLYKHNELGLKFSDPFSVFVMLHFNFILIFI